MDSSCPKLNMHKNTWRLIESGFQSPYINMASDEVLIDFFSEGKIPPTLRFYGWNPDSFSFGLFQNIASLIDTEKCASVNIPFVRRMTGGAIVYHGDDISYSLVCRRDDLGISGSIKESYKKISEFLINAFRLLGLNAEHSFKAPMRQVSNMGFCCQEHEAYDITVNEKKLGGNAQRRRRDVIFQHGFLPLNDNFKRGFAVSGNNKLEINKSFTSLGEALKRPIKYIEIKELLKKSFKDTFRANLEKSFFTKEERRSMDELAEFKYSKSKWNIERLDYARICRLPCSSQKFTGEPAGMVK